MGFILGFYPFSGGFLLPPNWTANDQAATAAANTPPDAFSSNGTLGISSSDGIHTYDYVQNADYGDMEVLLKYNETTGVLVEFNSSFLDYHMNAVLITEEEGDDTPDNPLKIPGYNLIFLVGISTLSLGAIIYKKKH